MDKLRFIYFQFGLFFMINFSLIHCEKYQYKIENFTVPLDHFSFSTNQTFQIRYLVNDSYSKGDHNEPIFFYTGNEGDIELFAQNTGFMWDIADEFHATLVFAEHRYYGKSLPFGNKSFTLPEYSGYLTSEQALADYAQLLVDVLNPKQRPVIAFGGSYGGMLSAWFRMKYPHLITGAIAASAPVLQFTADCNRFNTILTSVFTAGHKDCSKNIRQSWDALKKYAATPDGRNLLNNKFKLCPTSNLTKPEDLQQFNEYLTDVYGNLAMVNYPYATDFLAPLPPNPVTQFCSKLNGTFDDERVVDALQQALSIYSNFTGQLKCLETKSAYDPSMGDLGWDFQSCTEMVMPMCSKDDKKNMFPPEEWNFNEFSDKCNQRFKVRPVKNMAITVYGNKLHKYASNIVFSNGLLDPWSGGGVLRSQNPDVIIIIIPDTAHHLDLRGSNPNDPASVIEARDMEKNAIRKWLTNDDTFY